MLKKILRSATHASTENWVLHGFGRHVLRPWTIGVGRFRILGRPRFRILGGGGGAGGAKFPAGT